MSNRLRGVPMVEESVGEDGLVRHVTKGLIHMADQKENLVVPAPAQVSPTGAPVVPQVVVTILTVLGSLAAVAMAVAAAVPAAPAWVATVAGAVLAVCSVFGVASPGVRKLDQK